MDSFGQTSIFVLLQQQRRQLTSPPSTAVRRVVLFGDLFSVSCSPVSSVFSAALTAKKEREPANKEKLELEESVPGHLLHPLSEKND